jgi:hypothetical protein
MKRILIAVCVVLLAASFTHSDLPLPKGWIIAGSNPEDYVMGLDTTSKDSNHVATIKSTAKKCKGFGTLMQQTLPDKYKGKRVKFSGRLKLENVDGWAGLWMRVDINYPYTILAFDNMGDRQLKGSIDWQTYSFELDVIEEAELICFGALLSGKGQIWFDDMTIEIISDIPPSTTIQQEPVNLNFEGK